MAPMSFPSVLIWFLGLALGISSAHAERDISSKAAIEYGAIPSAIGNSRRSEVWLNGSFGLKWKSETSDRFRFEALINADLLLLNPSISNSMAQTLGAPQALEWNKSGSPHFFEDQEFFIEHRLGRTRTSLGSRTLRWGLADIFDPLDQINSRRMERPIQSVKRGEWMLFSELRGSGSGNGIGAVSLEGFVIPIKRGAILPSQTSAWLPRQLYIPNLPDTEFLLPTSLEYRYLAREEKDAALRWNYGARALWRPGDSEVVLQYDEGASSFPSIRPLVSGPLIGIQPDGRRVIEADPLILLKEIYYRERHYGASLTQPLGTLLARLQIAKTEPLYAGRELAHHRSDLSIALEREIRLGYFGSLTVLLQGFRNFLEDDRGGNDLASFSRLFDRAAAVGLRLAPSETTSLTVGGLQSFATKGGTLVMAGLGFDLSSSLSLEFGWNWIAAPLDAPIGPYKNNDGGSLKLTASF